jgi:hypothetical protein
MAETNPNWHDAHALLLIDRALEEGGFTPELVAEIGKAIHDARNAGSPEAQPGD